MSEPHFVKAEASYDPAISPHTIPKREQQSPEESSLTPTRGHPSYDSSTDYRASDYLHISPSDHQTPSSVQDGSYGLTGTSSSHTTPQRAEDSYRAYDYPEYTQSHDEFGNITYVPAQQTTTLDDMTPVVRSEIIMSASSMPRPPHVQPSQPHLQSPFKAVDPMAYSTEHQQMDPNGLIYFPQYSYPDGSPQELSSYDPQQQYYTMAPGMTYIPAGPSNSYQPPPPVPYAFPPQFVMGDMNEDERSRRVSPSEQSISSNGISLTRSGSTSSEMLAKTARPKVKLSHEDKRNIVLMAREHTQLRQEDIAQQYGVDRSTISKIVLNAERWLGPQPTTHHAASKTAKSLTARFPGVDARMNEWMDKQIEMGGDIRDAVARNMAKVFAQEIGFPDNRFKASAKWLDKFKDRRKASGRPEPPPVGMTPYPLYHFTGGQYVLASPSKQGSVMLSRSQSSVTISSESSMGQDYVNYQESITPNRMAMKSESDLLNMATSASRARSQSSPQLLHGPGTQTPSSGKAPRTVRPSPTTLQRQNSYHGTSPSPRRPVPLSRANSSQGVPRRSRPNSFAASAFGITPMEPVGSPLSSPSHGRGSISHTRQRSELGLSPFASLSLSSISPDMSESGEHVNVLPMGVAVPPMTPITPGSVNGAGVFPNTDYGEIQDFGPVHHPGYAVQVGSQPGYATMPNKMYQYPPQAYYGGPQYVHPYSVIPVGSQEQMGQEWSA